MREDVAAELADLAAAGLARHLPPTAGTGPEIAIAGRPAVNLSGHNYLGLAAHPALVAAAAAALTEHGLGAGGARLTAGNQPEHRSLEAAACDYLGEPAALLFNSGYAANLGVVTALAGRGDAVYSDARNHASLVDGARLSRADVHVFPHGDAATLARLLAAGRRYRRRLVATDSLFSVDGDEAPLAALAAAARDADALLVVDEAHAGFACGPGGRGLAAETGVRPDLRIVTLSKALGAFGAVVVGEPGLIQLLVNRARPFIFTTALPPCLAAAGAAGIAVATSAEGDALRARLARHSDRLRRAVVDAGWPAPPGRRHVLPLIVGDAAAAMRAAAWLAERGVFAQALRPPTVPDGASCLRLAPSAAHSDLQIDHVAVQIAALRREL